jgi:hypothetical protein
MRTGTACSVAARAVVAPANAMTIVSAAKVAKRLRED